jgi:hypothetical protein
VNLEDYFKKNLERFKKKTIELQDKYPAISSALNIDKDPHIEHMISAFSFVGSHIQYKQNQKLNRETKSIIYNFPSSIFNPSPPMGILKLLPDSPCKIKYLSNINSSSSIFKSLYEHTISKVEIQEIKREDDCIKITFLKLSNNIDRIDLYCEFSVLNKIFKKYNQIDVTVLNREQYKTQAKCVLRADLDLKIFN